MRMLAIYLITAAVVLFGCTGGELHGPEDWTIQGDVGDGPRDVRDARTDAGAGDVLEGDGISEVPDMADLTDTSDMRDAGPSGCTCPVEGATCKRIDQRAVCVVDGDECDFDVHGAECRPECTGFCEATRDCRGYPFRVDGEADDDTKRKNRICERYAGDYCNENHWASWCDDYPQRAVGHH